MSSVSQILRQTRENRGILLDEVARRTYIKLPYLEALERGSVEQLPAPVFVYGYIRQYAKLLGLDASELVQMYQQEVRQEPVPLVLAPARGMADNEGDPEPLRYNGNGNGDRISNGFGNGNGLGHGHTNGLAGGLGPSSEALEFSSGPYLDGLRPRAGGIQGSVAMTDGPDPMTDTEPQIAEAQREAQRIIAEAHREAQALKKDAERYAHQVLADLEAEIARALSVIRNGRQFLSQRRRPSAGMPSLPDLRR